jgi:hypothetical protein
MPPVQVLRVHERFRVVAVAGELGVDRIDAGFLAGAMAVAPVENAALECPNRVL